MRFKRPLPVFAALAAFLVMAAASFAQEVTAADLEELKAMITEAQSFAHNSWIMTSSAIVLMMTAPGLILFYGGLVRAKNVLSVMMQSFFCMGMVSILWLIYGYSVAFGGAESSWWGGLGKAFLAGVSTDTSEGLPEMTVMFFQLMFAIITPALITGAFAERFRFRALVPFIMLWSTIVYFPLTKWVWNGGILAGGEWFGPTIEGLDFAGGTVVHISSGVSALVCAFYLGKRRGYPGNEFAPHHLVISAIGAGLLWVGWFGFNAGSALAADGLASNAFAATHFSAAGAAVSWMIAEWLTRGKPSLLGVISGVVAGLVGVTPAAGFVTPVSGLIIGLITGVVCFAAVTYMKPALGFDDSLDVFGIHGLGGMVGAILTGVFAAEAVGGTGGLLEGNGGQVVHQILSVVVTIVLAVVATLLILILVDKTIGIRPTEEDEMTGLDLVDHGETGYHRLTAE